MQLSGSSSARILAEALGVGCIAALFHALAEAAFLRWNNLRLAPLDVAILIAIPLVAACIGALLFGAAVCLVRSRRPDHLETSAGNRKLIWTLFVCLYLVVLLKTIAYWEGWGSAFVILLPVLVPVGIAWFAVMRAGQNAAVLTFSTALVATTLCGVQLLTADWEGIAVPGYFDSGLIPLSVLCLIALVFAVKHATSSFQPIHKAARSVAVVSGAWIVLFANFVSPPWLSGLSGGTQANAANPSRPNIILIVLDTVRASHLDLFGYDRQTMPNLRRFAEQECQIRQRIVTSAPWTLPSHASMFTGLYASAHGGHYPFMIDKNSNVYAYPMRNDVPTMAEFLNDRGYHTAGIVGNYGILSGFGVSRGFESYDASPGSPFLASHLLWADRFRVGPLPSLGSMIRNWKAPALHRNSVLFSVREPPFRRALEITDEARQWLNDHGDQPFFLFLNYFDAHAPYSPAPEDDERFGKRPGENEWFSFPQERFDLAEARGEDVFSEAEVEFLKAQYDASMVSLDRELVKLWDYLKRAEFYANTLIFITSDHGESFLEHDMLGHGTLLDSEQLGGFVLVKTPKWMHPVKPSPFMQGVDFFPTVVDMLGEELPPHFQGSPWGNNRDYALAELFCRTCGLDTLSPNKFPEEFRREMITIVTDRHKLVRTSGRSDKIYSLDDPEEKNPTTDRDPAFMQQVEKTIASRRVYTDEMISKNPADDALLEKLKSLGYVK